MSKPQNLPQRTCHACREPLPEGSRATRKYCSSSCSDRAESRRRRGQPEADPALTAEQATALEAEIHQQVVESARLRELIARIHATRQRWQTKATTVEDRIAAIRRRTDRIEKAAARREAKANRRTEEAEAEKLELQALIRLLGRAGADSKHQAAQAVAADRAARRVAQELRAERQLNRCLRLHYPILLGRYSQLKDQVFYDEFDRDFHTTLQLLRKQSR